MCYCFIVALWGAAVRDRTIVLWYSLATNLKKSLTPHVGDFFLFCGVRMDAKMAGKNGSKSNKAAKSTRAERADFVGYVNLTLTEEDGIDFTAWLGQGDIAQEAYVEALIDGYQFSLKYDTANDTFICSVSNWDVGAKDAGIIYSARAADIGRATEKAVYVLSRKMNWDLSNGYVKHQLKDAF